jgi:hypothetical protein
MEKILLILLVTGSFTSAQTSNPEYLKMLDTRATILGIPKTPQPEEAPSALLVLSTEEQTLNSQLTNLLEQLKNLDTTS